MLTKEQINELKQFEEHFRNAAAGFCRGVYKEDVDALRPIYESLGYHLDNPRCGECILTMIKVIGAAYKLQIEGHENKRKRNSNSASRRTKARGKNDDHQQRADKDEVKETNN